MELARHRALTQDSLAVHEYQNTFVEMELARHRALTHCTLRCLLRGLCR